MTAQSRSEEAALALEVDRPSDRRPNIYSFVRRESNNDRTALSDPSNLDDASGSGSWSWSGSRAEVASPFELVDTNISINGSDNSLVEEARASECAKAPGTCRCHGTAYYGAFQRSLSASEMVKSGFVVKAAGGTVACNVGTFGGDPHAGYHTHCFCQGTGAKTATYCAAEGGHCQCGGVVFYGGRYRDIQVGDLKTNGWASKPSNTQLTCNVRTFGGDPAPGLHKTCVCSFDNGPTANHCAREGETCSCMGTVWYGVPKRSVQVAELTKSGFRSKSGGGSTVAMSSSNGGMGRDPHGGYHKVCYCQKPGQSIGTPCAKEGGTCHCSGTVYYGHHFPHGIPVSELVANKFEARHASGNLNCGGSFRTDPAFGWWKLCFCHR